MINPKREKKFDIKELEDTDITKAYDKASKKKTKHFITLKLLAETGMRSFEVAKIKVGNIDFKNKTITLEGKGDISRTIRINTDLTNILKMWIDSQKLSKYSKVVDYSREHISRISKRYTGLSAHKLRHIYALKLVRNGAQAHFVKEQLCHSDLSVTDIYFKYMNLEKDRDKLENLYDH